MTGVTYVLEYSLSHSLAKLKSRFWYPRSRGSLIIVLGLGLKVSLSGMSIGIRSRRSSTSSSAYGVLSPAVQKLSELEETLWPWWASGLAGVIGHVLVGAHSSSVSLLLSLLLLLQLPLLLLLSLLLLSELPS